MYSKKIPVKKIYSISTNIKPGVVNMSRTVGIIEEFMAEKFRITGYVKETLMKSLII